MMDKAKNSNRICCAAPSCSHTFASNKTMEEHYENHHCFQCGTCGTLYETERLLHIHYHEVHDDSLKLALAQGTAQIPCLCCDQNFSSDQDRLKHLQAVHQFPSWFRFVPKSRYCHPIKRNVAVSRTLSNSPTRRAKLLANKRSKHSPRKLHLAKYGRKFRNDSIDLLTAKMLGLTVPGRAVKLSFGSS